jgi:hypothetical protein
LERHQTCGCSSFFATGRCRRRLAGGKTALGTRAGVSYAGGVSGFLRFVGVVNAAIWLGAGIFVLFVFPAVFSPEMHQLFGDEKTFKYYSGAVAMVLFKRFFALQYVCGTIALLHLIAEKLYLGRPFPRLGMAVVLVVFGLGLAGGVWLRPRMEGLRNTMYSATASQPQKDVAEQSFKRWHVISNLSMLVMIGGLLVHVVRVTRQEDTSRYVNFSKIWG